MASCPNLAEFVEKVGAGPDFWRPLLVGADIFLSPQCDAEAVLIFLPMRLNVWGIDQAVIDNGSTDRR